MKYDVFISYSSHDQKVVEGICGYLESCGIRCFVAYRDIPRGVVWADAIVEALDASRMMVVVFSDHFNNSPQVNREIEIASEERKHILTYRLSDTAFRGAKKYYLKNLNWIDAFPDPEKSFGSLAEGVAKLLDLKLKTPDNAEGPSTPKPSTPQPPTPPKKPLPKWVWWTMALLSLVLAGLRFGIDSYQETQREDGKGCFGVYQVGDYYNCQGKEGVVFAVSADGRHGKIVSLAQSGQPWCSKEEYACKTETGASDEENGWNNQQKIEQIKDWPTKYPAFKWCADQGEGWYLPAINELKTLYNNLDAVNSMLKAKGADLIGRSFYWSSTESPDEFCAWRVGMGSGFTSDYYKYSLGYVRAVSAF